MRTRLPRQVLALGLVVVLAVVAVVAVSRRSGPPLDLTPGEPVSVIYYSDIEYADSGWLAALRRFLLGARGDAFFSTGVSWHTGRVEEIDAHRVVLYIDWAFQNRQPVDRRNVLSVESSGGKKTVTVLGDSPRCRRKAPRWGCVLYPPSFVPED